MRTQARGLAKAVANQVIEKVVSVKRPWRWLPAGWPGVLAGVDPQQGDRLDPPWPDLIVSCGRRSAILGLAVKKAAAGGPLLVHVQDPRTNLRDFDLVIAMAHDDVSGPKVMKVMTALHDMTPERLAEAARTWTGRLARLPRPLTGVLVGGPTNHSPFGVAEARELLSRLQKLRAAEGGGAVIVPSRRTPEDVLAIFLQAAKDDPGLWTWDRTGENPYVGVLALADRLVVTSESVSMVSEALATPHPVELFTANVRKRHERFIQDLTAGGFARPFDGEAVAAKPRPVLDTTGQAAAAVGELLRRR